MEKANKTNLISKILGIISFGFGGIWQFIGYLSILLGLAQIITTIFQLKIHIPQLTTMNPIFEGMIGIVFGFISYFIGNKLWNLRIKKIKTK